MGLDASVFSTPQNLSKPGVVLRPIHPAWDGIVQRSRVWTERFSGHESLSFVAGLLFLFFTRRTENG